MRRLTFVDASAWVALSLPTETKHESAAQWFEQNNSQLLTSDYMIDEALTALLAKGHRHIAYELGESLFSGQLASLEFASQIDVINAWHTFRGFVDKHWSFSDCVSRSIMLRLGIVDAFSFDQHFLQFGGIRVHPQFVDFWPSTEE